METRQRLAASAPNGWPREGFSLDENRCDLRRHEAEFRARIAFAFTVLSLEQSEVLGCVYLNPPAASSSDVDVYLWVREREYARGLAQHLHRSVDAWLASEWPFTRIRYVRPDYYFATGSCLCGAVRFYAGPITGPFELCHCSRCRRASGSTFAAMVGAGDVRFAQGADLVRTIDLPIEDHPPAYSRSFCGTCGSPLPDPSIHGAQEIPAGCLTDTDLIAQRHIYVDDAPAWSFPERDLPSYTQNEIRRFRQARQRNI